MKLIEQRTAAIHAVMVSMVVIASASRAISDESSNRQEWSQEREYPPGELGKAVRLGEAIVSETSTHPLSKPYVGNSLNCTSCHLNSGRHRVAASFLATAAAYPAWSPREERVITLEDRVLNCFMRSQNGIRPPNGSQVSVAIATYITWLSQGNRLNMNAEKPLGPNHTPILDFKALKPNVEHGASLYADRCGDCHGGDGQGTDEGPPVWGDQSYNDGAGLSRNDKLASWLKVAMPLDDADLTDQEAYDLAAYLNDHPRPQFRLQDHLPAKGDRDRSNDKQ